MAHAHGYDAWPMVQGSWLGGLAQAHRSATCRKTDTFLETLDVWGSTALMENEGGKLPSLGVYK
jgi:hypothetical protein